jgi:hypothetical protein
MCPTKPCYRTTGGGMSPASFSHQTHTTSAFRCRTFLFARDRSICLRRGAAPHVRLLAMPCTTETPEGKACTKEAGEAPPSIIQPAADRRDNAAALPLPPWRTRRPAGTQPRRQERRRTNRDVAARQASARWW